MRIHLFEWEDFSWYPDVLRTAQTDYLRFLMETFDVFRAVIPQLGMALRQSGEHHLVDFCSGGGGSLRIVQEHLEKDFPGIAFRATLSDLYPNVAAFQQIERESDGKITHRKEPVDVRRIPEAMSTGFWTVFNGFHHLPEPEAQALLQAAVDRKRPIGIFEPIDKSVLQLIINTFALTVLMFLVTPFIRPFRWSRLLFTYPIPLIPFFTLWDGWVSVLRLYTPAHLRQIVSRLAGHTNYDWKVGKARHLFGTVIYLIGLPHSSTKTYSS